MEVFKGKGTQCLQLTLEWFLKIHIYTYVLWGDKGGR